MICPKCGYKRTDKDDPGIPSYQCPFCGIIYSKYGKLPPDIHAIKQAKTQKVKHERPTFDWVTLATNACRQYKIIEQKHPALVLVTAASALFCGVIVLTVILLPETAPPPTPVAKIAPKPQPEMPVKIYAFSTSATELVGAYQDNTIAADQRFKGRRYNITGVVGSINTDFLGNPYVVMQNPLNAFMGLTFSFPKSKLAELATLRKGMTIMLQCTGAGDIAKIPYSKDCEIRQ